MLTTRIHPIAVAFGLLAVALVIFQAVALMFELTQNTAVPLAFIISASFTGVYIWWLIKWHDDTKEKQRIALRKMQATGDLVVHITQTSPATDLVPIVLDLHKAHGVGRVEMVGGNGSYVMRENGPVLTDGFRKWTDCGIFVSYFLIIPPSDDVIKELTQVSSQFPPGKFQALHLASDTVDLSDKNSDEDILIQEMQSVHPVLIYKASPDKAGKMDEPLALWIEGNHPVDSISAYNVVYFPPARMADRSYGDLFRKCGMAVTAVKRHSVPLQAA